MTETKSNNGLKVIAGLLGVVLLGTIIYTVSLYQDKKKTTTALTQEKELVVEDLNNLKSEYDKAILKATLQMKNWLLQETTSQSILILYRE